MNESDFQRVYIYPIYPRESKLYSDQEFVCIGNRNIGGSHLNAFYIKNNKSFYFDSFDGQPDSL